MFPGVARMMATSPRPRILTNPCNEDFPVMERTMAPGPSLRTLAISWSEDSRWRHTRLAATLGAHDLQEGAQRSTAGVSPCWMGYIVLLRARARCHALLREIGSDTLRCSGLELLPCTR